MMVYLDSCILIYRLEGAPEFAEPVIAAIRDAAGTEFCITDLVRLECLVGPIRQNDTERRQNFEAHFRKLKRLPLRRAVFELGAQLRAHHRLKTSDAIHAAAAIHHGCEELWTNDGRLGGIGDRVKIRILP